MHARTIQDVIRDIDEVIEYSRRTSWRIGYFAALYRHVAVAFEHAASHGVFDDAKRIERLDVAFVNRFLAAVDAHQHGRAPSKSWSVAFDAAEKTTPTVMQHLLLGMNAHIDFDLGIAVAEVCSPAELPGFRPDFDRMNRLLGSLLGVVEADLAKIWPWLGWLHRIAGSVEDGIINFSMRVARTCAWELAESLVALPPDERAPKIAAMDQRVAALGRDILKPGFGIDLVFLLMRIEQHGTVPQLIDILLSNRMQARMAEAVNSVVVAERSKQSA